MSAKNVKVKINNITVTVAQYLDAATSQKVADEVAALYRKIEDNSSRIDTQAFLLQTAYAFAVKVRELEATIEDLKDGYRKELDAIHARLEALLTDAPPPREKSTPTVIQMPKRKPRLR
ncbi:MAG: hypothetical protein KA184_07045 [Candidatus Hydrogenedentes bacterium]|nr:hypothetical protein [Candidatus Hydrogenedentota bacterium]